MKLLVTGGAGFIGSAVIRLALKETNARSVNVDKLTYAQPDALAEIAGDPRYAFEKVDICDRAALERGVPAPTSPTASCTWRREPRRPLD